MPDVRSLGRSAAQRQRANYVLIGLGILVVALVLSEVFYQVANSSTGAARRSVASWSASLRPILSESNSLAAALHQLRQLDALANRGALEDLVSNLQQMSAAGPSALADIAIPAPSAKERGLVSSLLMYRADGISALARGINLAIAGSPSPGTRAQATASIVAAGQALIAGDRAGARFQLLSRRQAGHLTVWVSSPRSWDQAAVTSYVNRLSASPAYRVHHSLKLVAVSLSPAPLRITGLPTPTISSTPASTTTTIVVSFGASGPTGVSGRAGLLGTSGQSGFVRPTTTTIPVVTTTTLQIPPAKSVSVLGPTNTLSPIVVVENTGNVAESAIQISATLEATGAVFSGTAPRSSSASIASLGPRQSHYLNLAPIKLYPKVSTYRLVVSLSDPDVATMRAAVSLSIGS